jgi:hypothetical protein
MQDCIGILVVYGTTSAAEAYFFLAFSGGFPFFLCYKIEVL